MSEATILPFPARLRLAPVAQPEEVLAGEGKPENIAPRSAFGLRAKAYDLAGCLGAIRAILRAPNAPRKRAVCPSLFAAAAAQMEQHAYGLRTIADSLKSYEDYASAALLQTIADALETRAAQLAPDTPEAS